MAGKKLSPCYQSPWWAKANEVLLSMGSMSGRKSVVVFSDSEIPIECRNSLSLVDNSPSRFLIPALSSNVAIYPVDPRGGVPVVPYGDASSESYDFNSGAAVPYGQSVLNQITSRTYDIAQENQILQYVAAQTGGRSLVGSNKLDGIFQQLRQDSGYYELAYYLPDLQSDGSYHRIRLEVDRPGVRLIAKKGYFAPIPFKELSRARKREWLYQALLSNRPLSDVRVLGRVDVFPDTNASGATVPITCELNWWVRAEDYKQRQWVMIVGILEDEHGVVRTFTSTNSWEPQEQERVDPGYKYRSAEYNLLAHLAVGNYRLRIAATDLESEAVGSAEFRFKVEKTTEHQFVTSPVILADKMVHQQKDASAQVEILTQSDTQNDPPVDPLIWNAARLIPALVPSFSAAKPLYIFLRIYSNQADQFSAKWSATASLKDVRGKVILGPFQVEMPNVNPELGVPILYKFDLRHNSIREGSYTAELQLSEQNSGRHISYSHPLVIRREGQLTPPSL